jgi:hypothetical protein
VSASSESEDEGKYMSSIMEESVEGNDAEENTERTEDDGEPKTEEEFDLEDKEGESVDRRGDAMAETLVWTSDDVVLIKEEDEAGLVS